MLEHIWMLYKSKGWTHQNESNSTKWKHCIQTHSPKITQKTT